MSWLLGAFEKHVLGPRREAIKQARLAEERAAEAAEERDENRATIAPWNQRRLQAGERGEPFDKPFPGDEDAKDHTREIIDLKISDDSTRQPTVKTWNYEYWQIQVTLQHLSESLIKVTHRDQVGYLGLVKDFDADKPYGWSATGSGVSEDGIDIGSKYSTPESAVSDLCRIMLSDQRKEDSKRTNPEERKQGARVVLEEFFDEFFDELPELEDG